MDGRLTLRRAATTVGLAVAVLSAGACTPTTTPTPPLPVQPVAGGNGAMLEPVVSADGRWVAYASQATDLVPGDANGSIADLYLTDRLTGTTTRVATGDESVGTASPSAGSPADLDPPRPRDGGASIRISSDWRYVAFAAWASDLVSPAPPPAYARGVYRYDRVTGAVERLSPVAATPCAGGSPAQVATYLALLDSITMSQDGGVVSWTTWCGDGTALALGVSVWRPSSGVITTTAGGGAMGWYLPVVSGDGQVVVAAAIDSYTVVGNRVGRLDTASGDLIDSVATPAGTTVAGVDATGARAIVSNLGGPANLVDLATGDLTSVVSAPPAGTNLFVTATSPSLQYVTVLTSTTGGRQTLDRVEVASHARRRLQSGRFDGGTTWTSGTPFEAPGSITDAGLTVLRVVPSGATHSQVVAQG